MASSTSTMGKRVSAWLLVLVMLLSLLPTAALAADEEAPAQEMAEPADTAEPTEPAEPDGAELLEILDLVLERLEPLLNLLGFLHIVPEALALRGRLKLLDFLLRALKLQRAAQILKTGLGVIELYLIFFKFKHCSNHFQMIYFIDFYYTQKTRACKLLFLYAI